MTLGIEQAQREFVGVMLGEQGQSPRRFQPQPERLGAVSGQLQFVVQEARNQRCARFNRLCVQRKQPGRQFQPFQGAQLMIDVTV